MSRMSISSRIVRSVIVVNTADTIVEITMILVKAGIGQCPDFTGTIQPTIVVVQCRINGGNAASVIVGNANGIMRLNKEEAMVTRKGREPRCIQSNHLTEVHIAVHKLCSDSVQMRFQRSRFDIECQCQIQIQFTR